MKHLRLGIGSFVIVLILSACPAGPDPQTAPPAHPQDEGKPPANNHKPLFTTLPKGSSNVWTQVKTMSRDAKRAGRQLIVYVGAEWCKPCKRFVNTVNAGTLDQTLRDITFVTFDYDKDHAALKEGGYLDKFVPIFVVPGPDGRASKKRFSGTVSGKKSLDTIVTRLRGLLQRPETP